MTRILTTGTLLLVLVGIAWSFPGCGDDEHLPPAIDAPHGVDTTASVPDAMTVDTSAALPDAPATVDTTASIPDAT